MNSIQLALAEALAHDLWVDIDYVSEDGTHHAMTARILAVTAGTVFVVRQSGPRDQIPLTRIAQAQCKHPIVIRSFHDDVMPDLPDLG